MSVKHRDNIRNLAIIAHVDHGKTTLVDAMLHQSGLFRANEKVAERMMDGLDLEREKGITIMAKNTAINWHGTTINIVDTPGHADFGGEVQRVLKMVDGCLLLVDASEGPLPQTRYVLSNALAAGLSPIVVINKIDRPDARIAEVVDEVLELFFDLDASEEQCDFPILFTVAKTGTATRDINVPGNNLSPLFDVILENVPAPTYEEGHPLQLQITTLDYSSYLGQMGIGRVSNGTLKIGDAVLMTGGEGGTTAKITKLYGYSGLKRFEIQEANPGEIVAIAGIEGIQLGWTLTDPLNPKPMQALKIDEPSLEMIFSVNTSPFSGLEGKYVTSRQLRDRLFKETLGNPSLKVEETNSADSFRVLGRGELQFAILLETMRREGFEVGVGKPRVLTKKDENGAVLEPWEHLIIDCPEEYIGVITQTMGFRKGRMMKMVNHSSGWVRLEFEITLRGLIGLRSQLIVETRGTAIINHIFLAWREHVGEIPHRKSGVLIADRTGKANAYALQNLQERGQLFVGPGVEHYSGMIVGENSRTDDMWVNPSKEKKLTNMRASGSDDNYMLHPPKIISLENALEFIADDEIVEITPESIRLRKRLLTVEAVKKASRGA
ncbi:translational GTPase TypA [bacterium]|nr:translational GTPase TypA [bacterium]